MGMDAFHLLFCLHPVKVNEYKVIIKDKVGNDDKKLCLMETYEG